MGCKKCEQKQDFASCYKSRHVKKIYLKEVFTLLTSFDRFRLENCKER